MIIEKLVDLLEGKKPHIYFVLQSIRSVVDMGGIILDYIDMNNKNLSPCVIVRSRFYLENNNKEDANIN